MELAANFKGLAVREDDGGCRYHSDPIKTYVLGDDELFFLNQQGIVDGGYPGEKKHHILIDTNASEGARWSFQRCKTKKQEFNLSVELWVGIEIDIKKRGVVFWPRAASSFISPAERFPQFRMFKALVDSDKNALVVAKEIAESDGSIIITWSELGLGGIRKLSSLFHEFAGGNDLVRDLARRVSGIFTPAPSQQFQQPSQEMYIAEPAQAVVFENWRKQLKSYRARLAV